MQSWNQRVEWLKRPETNGGSRFRVNPRQGRLLHLLCLDEK